MATVLLKDGGGEKTIPLELMSSHVKLSQASEPSTPQAAKLSTPQAPDRAQLPAVKEYVRYELKRRQNEFTDQRELTLFVGSMNLHALEQPCCVREWLASPQITAAGVPRPDIYAVGFQELVDLTTSNLLSASLSDTLTGQWAERCEKDLNDGLSGDDCYKLVQRSNLVGIGLLIFAQKRHFPFISGVNGQATGCGVLGMMGNKGACCIRLQLYDSTICFVCSHLAAHRSNVQGRNKDFNNLVTRTRFDVPLSDSEILHHDRGACGIMDHELVVWMGDLNYRFESELTLPECYRLIEAKDWASLRKFDQLNVERSQSRAFIDFEEGVLDFQPSYKFIHNTDRYDKGEEEAGGSKKLRMPAYTDRILWQKRDAFLRTNITQIHYGVCMEVQPSDHRPVLGLFNMQVKVVSKERQMELAEELVRMHDLWENQSIPKIQLGSNTLVFSDLRFARASVQTLQLQNTGQVPAVFNFVPKGEETNVCPSWVTVSPLSGVLMPGTDLDITITACIDARSARKGKVQELSDILVIHVSDGADSFVMLQGKYVSMCFGASIELLARKNTPSNPALARSWPTAGLPSAIVELVSILRERECWVEPDIFVEGGCPTEFQEIRDVFDREKWSLLSGRPALSLAEVLIEFLMSTATPLVPAAFLPQTYIGDDALTWGRHILRPGNMPDAHRRTLMYIVEFIRLPQPGRTSSDFTATQTGMDSSMDSASQSHTSISSSFLNHAVLSAVFARCFMQADREEEKDLASRSKGRGSHIAMLCPGQDCLQRVLHELFTAPSMEDVLNTPPATPSFTSVDRAKAIRPTQGDKIVILSTRNTRANLVDKIGLQFTIQIDQHDETPYRIPGIKDWLSEDDVLKLAKAGSSSGLLDLSDFLAL